MSWGLRDSPIMNQFQNQEKRKMDSTYFLAFLHTQSVGTSTKMQTISGSIYQQIGGLTICLCVYLHSGGPLMWTSTKIQEDKIKRKKTMMTHSESGGIY